MKKLEYGTEYLLDPYNKKIKGFYIGWRDNPRTNLNNILLLNGKRGPIAYRFGDYSIENGIITSNSIKRSSLSKSEKGIAKKILSNMIS